MSHAVTSSAILEPGSAQWLEAARRARLLSWLSLGWMAVEGAVGLAAGIVAGSIALVAFGLDSFIEGFASLSSSGASPGHGCIRRPPSSARRSSWQCSSSCSCRSSRVEALRHLFTGVEADVSRVGIALTATSLIVMPVLGLLKHRLAAQLGSTATRGEGTQNLLCAYLVGGGARRPPRQRDPRPLVARPARRPRRRRRGSAGRAGELARRRLLRVTNGDSGGVFWAPVARALILGAFVLLVSAAARVSSWKVAARGVYALDASGPGGSAGYAFRIV